MPTFTGTAGKRTFYLGRAAPPSSAAMRFNQTFNSQYLALLRALGILRNG